MALMVPPDWWDALGSRIARRVGLFPRDRVMQKVASLIDREVARAGSPGWNEYLRDLDARDLNAPIWQSLLQHILVGETSFFRHGEQFEFLRTEVLRARAGPLTCWSAGCATGEEAFTLAVICREVGCKVTIWATDIAQTSLDAAAHGRVSPRRGTPDPRLSRWVRHEPDGWYVDESVRSLVRWEWLNLLEGEEFIFRNGPFDLILCRNVLIYFHEDAIARVVSLFERALVPDGWLMLGHAESLLFRRTPFHMVAGGLAYTRQPPALKPPHPRPVAPVMAREEATPGPSSSKDRPSDVVEVAVALEQGGRLSEAAALLRKALEEDRSNILARLCLSGIYRRSGQIDAAAAQLRLLSLQLNGRPDDEIVPVSDGLTVGALRMVIAPYASGD